uniref:Trypsin-like serine protease n=1 Tax=Timema cristinae TaxID=61476 RepID=A0A7R9GNX0_TIMCR|nr:unnamed protein product [Timema cristinae]
MSEGGLYEPRSLFTVQHSCGDISGERTTYFRSPDYPGRSTGTLACDYDVTIQSDVCAVRVEFEKVDLARKLGGVCDIDQLFILNSVDGPTTGQCGPLSGYSTTVAVTPGQTKPVKLALLIQNEGYYRWSIKIVQLRCTELSNFQVPVSCGRQEWDAQTSSSELSHSFFNLWHDIKWRRDNTRYQGGTMKKHLQQSPHALQRDRVYKAQDRIVGGTDAALYEFPWQVAIFLEDLFFCGGAVINELFVLTAAHCIMTRDTPIEQLVLQIGDHDLSTMNETTHDVRKVKRISYHSHFHPFLLSNDIALLEMDKPASHTLDVVVTLLVGGITSFPQGEPSPILQKLIVETISNFQCSRIIEEPVGLGMICAAPDSLEGTCFGDSGGPLTVLDPDETDVLIGIVSFGVTGCAVIPAFPDLYTRVTEYLKWIDGDSGGPLTVLDPDETDVLIGIVSFGVTGCAVIPAFPDLYTRVTEYLKWIDVNAMQ